MENEEERIDADDFNFTERVVRVGVLSEEEDRHEEHPDYQRDQREKDVLSGQNQPGNKAHAFALKQKYESMLTTGFHQFFNTVWSRTSQRGQLGRMFGVPLVACSLA